MGYRSRRIFIRDYALPVSIGVHDDERRGPQTVVLNIDIVLAGAPQADDDALAAVLDYDFVRGEIQALVAGRHFNLQETLCQQILELFRGRPEIAQVRIASEKPDVYDDCAAVGYALEYDFLDD